MTSLHLHIASISRVAQGVLQFELCPMDGVFLPPFSPDAHVDIRLPGGLRRSYSLANDSPERHRYVLGIQHEPQGRGGSAWLHDAACVGTVLEVSPPANDFGLVEDADHSLFIAGGIGITPIWCMVQRQNALGRNWTLHYRARSRASAAFLQELRHPDFAHRVQLSIGDEGDPRPDIQALVETARARTHFYCCGPLSMLDAFESSCGSLDPRYVHLERFGTGQEVSSEGGFQVRLQRSGTIVDIGAGQTILAALEAHGVAVPSSCQQGVCGVCECRVLEGKPDHRDLVLSDDEKAAGTTMMICCSGSHSPLLVLDM